MTAGKPFGRDLDFDPPLEVPREQMRITRSVTDDCPCDRDGAPRWWCWVAAADCRHGKPTREQYIESEKYR